MKSNGFLLGSFCLTSLFTISLLELCSYGLFLLYPSLGPDYRLEAMSFAANRLNRVLQFDPACAEYSSELSYVLRPGSCRFRNLEYDTTWRINSQHLRGGQEPAQDAAIVVLGDSYAAGWGVEVEESFPALIESSLQKKVLTVAVPSYGTARELMLFDKLSRVRPPEVVILQYCDNDALENKEYLEQNFKLKIMLNSEYEDLVQMNREGAGYSLGKFSMFLGIQLRRSLGIEPAAATLEQQRNDKLMQGAAQAGTLAEILHHHGLTGSRLRVLIFDVCWLPPGPAPIVRELLALKQRTPGGWPSLEPINATAELQAEDYFSYDPHLRASGHRKIAGHLVKKILEGIR